METRLFWERDPGRRVCAYHEGRWRKGSFHSVLVSQDGAAHACSVGGGLRDTDVPVKICQKSGNERVCTALGSKLVFEGSRRVCREGFPKVEVIFEVKGLEGWLLERSHLESSSLGKCMSLYGSSSERFLTQHQLGVSDRLFCVLISPVPEAFSSAGFQCPLCCCSAADPMGCSAHLLGLL